MVTRTPARKPVEVKVVEIPLLTWVLYIQQLCFGCPFWIFAMVLCPSKPRFSSNKFPPGLDAETLGGHAEGASEGGWAAEENGRTRGIFLRGGIFTQVRGRK